MSGDLEAADSAAASWPDCPRCGETIATLTVVGPMDGIVGPCGCRVPPGALE